MPKDENRSRFDLALSQPVALQENCFWIMLHVLDWKKMAIQFCRKDKWWTIGELSAIEVSPPRWRMPSKSRICQVCSLNPARLPLGRGTGPLEKPLALDEAI
jgi:hypothetical protein